MKLSLLSACLFLCLSNAVAQNVGIGTTDPQQKLHIKGNLQLDDTSAVLFNLQAGDTSGMRFLQQDSVYGSMLYSADDNTLNLSGNDTVNGLHYNFNTNQTFIGRDYTIGSNEIFGISRKFTGAIGLAGMQVEVTGAIANRPYYGYAVNGENKAFHYYDSGSDQWRLFMGGTHLSIRGENGYTGIGVVTPQARLHVIDTIRIDNTEKPALQFYRGGELKTSLYQEGFGTYLRTDIPGGSLNLNTGGVNGLSVIADGRVIVDDKLGIGGVAPLDPLHVNGSMRLAGSFPELKFYNGVFIRADIGMNGFNMSMGPRTTLGKLFLKTNSIPRVTIDQDGMVGIGTSSPNALLDVAGAVLFDSVGIGTDSPNALLDVAGAVLFDSLGIGVDDPAQALHLKGVMRIDGMGGQVPRISMVYNDTLVGDFFANPTNLFLRNMGSGDISFMTDGLQRMAVHNNGDVTIGGGTGVRYHVASGYLGIGVDPVATLDVMGHSKFRGWLYLPSGQIQDTPSGILIHANNAKTLKLARSLTTGLELTLDNDVIIGDTTVFIKRDNSKVGINTDNPTYDLHVNGTFRTEASASIDGSFYANDGFFSVYAPLDEVRIGHGGSAQGYQLSVKGKIISEELKVQTFNNWPDYVFDDDYELRSLADTKLFIESNGHLPGVPSARDITADKGFEVGEMNRILLEKIEELTLHVIRLEEELNSVRVDQTSKN